MDKRCCYFQCERAATRQIMFPGMVAVPYCRTHAAVESGRTGRQSAAVDWGFINKSRSVPSGTP